MQRLLRVLRISGVAVLTVTALQLAGAGQVVASQPTFGCANNKCDGPYSCEFAGFNTCCMSVGGGACTTYDCMMVDTCPG